MTGATTVVPATIGDAITAAYDCSNFVSDNPCSQRNCDGECVGGPAPTVAKPATTAKPRPATTARLATINTAEPATTAFTSNGGDGFCPEGMYRCGPGLVKCCPIDGRGEPDSGAKNFIASNKDAATFGAMISLVILLIV